MISYSHERRLIWLIGRFDRPEHRGIASAARKLGYVAEFSELSAALAKIEDEAIFPELVLVAQHWPGEYSPAELAFFSRLSPLIRVWRVQGSWCEGESRTGQPFPGSMRTYWHQWPERFELERLSLQEGSCPEWGLPLTITEEERLLEALTNESSPPPSVAKNIPSGTKTRIAVYSSSVAMKSYLQDLLHSMDYEALHLPDVGSPVENDEAWNDAWRPIFSRSSLMIWDFHGTCPEEAESLIALRKRFPSLPTILLSGFPRRQNARDWTQGGNARIISKPFLDKELLLAINSFCNVAPSPLASP